MATLWPCEQIKESLQNGSSQCRRPPASYLTGTLEKEAVTLESLLSLLCRTLMSTLKHKESCACAEPCPLLGDAPCKRTANQTSLTQLISTHLRQLSMCSSPQTKPCLLILTNQSIAQGLFCTKTRKKASDTGMHT